MEGLGLDATARESGCAIAKPGDREFPDFRDGQVAGIDFRPMTKHRDQRGWLAEVYREDELSPEFHPVMAYVSETQPGVVRGPHEHVDQADHFAFVGPGDFKIFLWDARPDSPTYGNRLSCIVGASNPCTVILPPGVVHAYQCISDRGAWVFNLPNRLYAGQGKLESVDEIRHEECDDPRFGLF